MQDTEKALATWDASLPDHLRFGEESLQLQLSMFETSSNAGAWCYFMTHIIHTACVLMTYDVRPHDCSPDISLSTTFPVTRSADSLFVSMFRLSSVHKAFLLRRLENGLVIGCYIFCLLSEVGQKIVFLVRYVETRNIPSLQLCIIISAFGFR